MKIGYACTLANPIYGRMKTCRIKDVDEARLNELIAHNMGVLKRMMEYNVKNKIHLFRISSDLIPFGSSDVNQLRWWDDFRNQFEEIGMIAKDHQIRLSMHPGQYTVLNSPDKQVVERAVADLEYHCRILDAMKLDNTNKIIIHVGGVYQNRKEAIQRFETNYLELPEHIKRRLVIENDDRSYSAEEVLTISKKLNIPMVFDVFHHEVLPSNQGWTLEQWLDEIQESWDVKDGSMKIHYSLQALNKRAGAHSQTIDLTYFVPFYQNIQNRDLDVMLEVKDKNVSAIKCILVTLAKTNISMVETEWGRYKYLLLEHSHSHYLKARKCMREKENSYVADFFQIVQDGLSISPTIGSKVNAAMHVWGYFKDCATDLEKKQYAKMIIGIQNETLKIERLKNFLWKMTLKYEQIYLFESYYFIMNGEE